ncbi:MAG: translation initiation factor IF-2 [Syntrophobacterales bacterium]|nr:translation initiation factor IF-2 [Syntrophobacterales bacterium]
MSKIRVYELAKEFDVDSKVFISRIEKLGIAVKSHSSTLEEHDVERIREEFTLGVVREVVEKRVKSGVIRRRRVIQKPSEEVKPVEAKEESVEKTGDEEKQGEKKEVPEAKVTDTKAEAAEKEKAKSIEEQKAVSREPETHKVKEVPKRAEPAEKEKEVSRKTEKPQKPDYKKPLKKEKRSVEVVVDKLPDAGKKAFTKQRIGKKSRYPRKEIAENRELIFKPRKKEAVLKMKKTEITTPKAIKRRIKIGETITVGDLAKKMGVKSSEVISKLISLGTMVTINQFIDIDVATIVASDFGYQVERIGAEYDEFAIKVEALPEKLKPRAPVVTVMGHVDHGKTSLLDVIRETHVIDGEAGGITQAIGAYQVHVNDRDIVFVDTPGHEAFTSMRARGAQVTDIVVLVVAADDGVMDQTIEAINHSRAAEVPIIVAINKIDKPGANPDQIKQKLSELGLVPEEWGGDTIYAEVSAKKRTGIENLLELILLQADIMELKADPDRSATGIIIEAAIDKGRGPVATVIIQEGTLREGDAFVSKAEYGRVRALINDQGQRVTEAGPSMPVEVIGFSKVPKAGVNFTCVEDERKARNIAEYWSIKEREKELSKTSKITLEQLYKKIQEGVREFNVIIKGDVQGSIEALSDALNKLSTDDVKLKIIHSSTGAVTETDVLLASASDAIIIGFNVRPDSRVSELAEKEGVEIKFYDVIYNIIADVKAGMSGLLEPVYEEIFQGRAEVRDLFKVPKIGAIAGSYVIDGKVLRNSNIRLMRDGVVIYDGKIVSLKRFKDDAKEVPSGFECGIGLEGFNDIKVGDIIEAYTQEEVERTLE